MSKLIQWSEIFFEGVLSLLNLKKKFIFQGSHGFVVFSYIPLYESKIGIVGFEQVSNSMRL